MKKINKFLTVFAACALSFACAGCSENQKYGIITNIPAENLKITSARYDITEILESQNGVTEFAPVTNTQAYKAKSQDFFSMNTPATLVATADYSNPETDENFQKFKQEVKEVLDSVENSLSVSVSTSSISKFNAAQAGEVVEIDKTAFEVLSAAYDAYTLTQGYYNPAVYYSVQAYGFDGRPEYPKDISELPSKAQTEKFTELANSFSEIEIYEGNDGYFAKKPLKTVEIDGETCSLKIDLGGIGKGYATDIVNGLFDKYGFEYGSFNFGTSSYACKKFYKGGGYILSFVDPRSNYFAGKFMQLAVEDVCVSTSGDYEQCYIIDGMRYCHVIDPFTGSPVQTGIMTSVVVGGSAMEADALTTAIMAMGREKAAQFIKENLSDRQVLFTIEEC